MKKLSIILAAFVLALGLAQCKKETTPTTEEGNGVRITLDLRSNSRVIVNPGNTQSTTESDSTYIWTPVTYETGDRIYVGYNNAYVGYLDYDSDAEAFIGTVNIDEANVDGIQPLHFYLLGGKGFTASQNGNTFTVNISDQTARGSDANDATPYYPVVSYAKSNEVYTTNNTAYTAKLRNKCSIMKLNVTKYNCIQPNARHDIYITGMNNVVTVDFSNPNGDDNGFSYSPANGGIIKMMGRMMPITGTADWGYINNLNTFDMWAIVLPQDALPEGGEGTAFSDRFGDRKCVGKRPALPKIKRNQYLSKGVDMIVTFPGFSVSVNNDRRGIFLAPGNLQYQRSTGTWRFAEHQWDYVGTDHPFVNSTTNVSQPSGGNVTGSDNYSISDATYGGWIDLFGWATSGWDGVNNTYYRPTDYLVSGSGTTSSIGYGYGPLTGTFSNNTTYYNLTDQYANADWGVYNAGSLGDGWYTLDRDEWAALFKTRSTLQGKTAGKNTYALATVMGVSGLVLFPDYWDGVINGDSVSINYKKYDANQQSPFTTGPQAKYTDNTFDESTTPKWSELAAKGVAFLPAAGMRFYSSNINKIYYTGTQGWYWTNTSTNTSKAYYEIITQDPYSGSGSSANYIGINIGQKDVYRYYGMSVRLVKDYVFPSN